MKSLFGGGNKKIFLIIAIIVFVNLGLFVFFRFQNQIKFAPASLPSQLNQPTISGQQPAFTSDPDSSSGTDSSSSTVIIGGVLVGDGDPWIVLYDDPQTGSVAANLELVFTDQSVCDFGQGFISCSPMYYEVGTGIEVTGQKDGAKLIVSQIERAVSLMGQ